MATAKIAAVTTKPTARAAYNASTITPRSFWERKWDAPIRDNTAQQPDNLAATAALFRVGPHAAKADPTELYQKHHRSLRRRSRGVGDENFPSKTPRGKRSSAAIDRRGGRRLPRGHTKPRQRATTDERPENRRPSGRCWIEIAPAVVSDRPPRRDRARINPAVSWPANWDSSPALLDPGGADPRGTPATRHHNRRTGHPPDPASTSASTARASTPR